jgi:hypothetical protein
MTKYLLVAVLLASPIYAQQTVVICDPARSVCPRQPFDIANAMSKYSFGRGPDLATIDAQRAAIEAQKAAAERDRAQAELLRQQSQSLSQQSQQPQSSQPPPPKPSPEAAQRFLEAIKYRRYKWADFDAVVFRDDLEVTPDMVGLMAESRYAADIAYYLGSHPDVSSKIAHMPLSDAGPAIFGIEREIATNEAPR